MNLDDQLTELLASLGVTLEGQGGADDAPRDATRPPALPHAATTAQQRPLAGAGEAAARMGELGDELPADDARGEAELSLFQTSREHYGVFYRLDLVAGAPQLRIFAPEDEGAIKMRCYLVRAAPGTPVREWFRATRAHDGSSAYEEARDTAEQHLLFAAGESLKRLFWAGEPETMSFPAEITVSRLI